MHTVTIKHLLAMSMAILLSIPAAAQGTRLGKAPTQDESYFGAKLGFVGEQLLVAAPGLHNGSREGAVLVYKLGSTGWRRSEVLQSIDPSNEYSYAGTGSFLTTSRRAVIPSYPHYEIQLHQDDGFEREAVIEMPEGVHSSLLAFTDDHLAIRVTTARSTDSARTEIHLYKRTDHKWSPFKKIKGGETQYGNFEDGDFEYGDSEYGDSDNFSNQGDSPFSVWLQACFAGDELIVADGNDPLGGYRGSIRMYKETDGVSDSTGSVTAEWKLSGKIGNDLRGAGYIQLSRVSCTNDRFIVSAGRETSVKIVDRIDDRWESQPDLKVGGYESPGFLMEVVANKDYLLISSLPEYETGVVWLYRDDGHGYQLIRRVESPNDIDPSFEDNNGCFGISLAMTDEFIAAGTPFRRRMIEDSEYPIETGEAFGFSLKALDQVPRLAEERESLELQWSSVYPNPGRGQQKLQYTLPASESVTINIVDATGRLVHSIDEGGQGAGSYTAEIPTSDWARGVYFVSFEFGRRSVGRQKFVVL